MAADTIERFLSAPSEERLRLALDDVQGPDIQAYLGRSAFNEYVAVARRTVRKLDDHPTHLAFDAPTNLIFVPGIMGSLLKSSTLGGVWWIDVLRTRHHIDDLRLSSDGFSDAKPDHQVAPVEVDTAYEPFLAAVLRRPDFGHVTFPFDWRKPLSASTAALRDRILEIYQRNGNLPVHLVGHSMGGLMIRAALTEHGEALWPIMGRIVFIGTPHYGSPAIAGYLKNHFWGWEMLTLLGRYLSRETFRSMWGALAMLPAPLGIYPGTRANDRAPWISADSDDAYAHPCANFDLYDVASWKLDLASDETAQLQAVLDGSAEFHLRTHEAHLALDPSLKDRMAVIAGVGQKTLFRLAYDRTVFGLWERTEKITMRVEGDPHLEGDGRVPLASARLEGAGEVRYIKGVHGGLPMIPAVYEDVFRWLKGEPMTLPDTEERALREHLADSPVSEAPHLDGTGRADALADDPGYWDLEEPTVERLANLEARLAANQLPEFNQVRLM